MAKNTSSSAFRKIDVDQFNEDNFQDDDGPLQDRQGGGVSHSEVESLIRSGKNVDALIALLSSAPIGNKNQADKDAALALVMRVLSSIKQNQMEEAVRRLDNDQRDILMKYVYRGFETPSEGSSAHLLLWHEKTFAMSGLGCIVRVLTDRKQV